MNHNGHLSIGSTIAMRFHWKRIFDPRVYMRHELGVRVLVVSNFVIRKSGIYGLDVHDVDRPAVDIEFES